MKTNDPWLKAHWKTDKIVPKLVLTEVPHWNTHVAQGSGFKSYEVKLGKKILGRVEHEMEHIYRKAGRIITRSWHRRSWHYSAPNLSSAGLYYPSRKLAVHELVYHLVLHNKLPV